MPRHAASAPSPEQDARILNFVLLLEYLEADLYTAAEESGALEGDLLEFARVVGEQERQHVSFFTETLGGDARAKPNFDFGDATENPERFAASAKLLENTGVGAYNGQAANLTKDALSAAARIVSVEARHAAWIRAILGEDPAPRATDRPLTEAQVVAVIDETGFVP